MPRPDSAQETTIERRGARTAGHAPAAEPENLYGADLGPGAQLGGYLVEEMRSRGGFATVYRGRAISGGDPIALKVLHLHLCTSQSVLRRFVQEAQAVNLIRHPNIVRVHDFGELTDGRPYMAMEWLEGRDLQEELARRGPFSLGEAVAVVQPLVAALSAAHALGVVHRDLKASNVMTVPTGDWFEVRLVDFGIAKLVDAEDPERRSELTATGVRLGTPWTMAPEQILGRPVDARTDIYALGVLLFQLLTGRFPFAANSPVEVEEMHLRAPVPRPSELVPVPTGVDQVIARAMAKDRADRYASVEDLLADLERVHAPAASSPTRGIGLHVEAMLEGDDACDDELLDESDRVLESARRAAAAAGLTVTLESGNAIFAAAVLDEADAGRSQRERVLAQARALQAEMAGAETRVRVKIAVQVAPVVARRQAGAVELIGGELLALGQWADERPTGIVSVNPDTVAGLEEHYPTAELPTRRNIRRLV